jgi:hypothetical protein
VRILFLADSKVNDNVCASVLHGLRLLFGTNVIDFPRQQYMYKQDRDSISNVTGEVPIHTLTFCLDDVGIDRSDVERKINDHFFDLIVYGSIYRYRAFLDQVVRVYQPKDVLFIDGEDNPRTGQWALDSGFEDIYRLIYDRGITFKSELNGPVYDGSGGRYIPVSPEYPRIQPIWYAYPEEDIYPGGVTKDQWFATCLPSHYDTYIFPTKEKYYQDYRRSFFGFTWRKGTYNVMRTLEILMNNCVPLFLGKPDLTELPPTIMPLFPKQLCLKALQLPGPQVEIIDDPWAIIKNIQYHMDESVFNRQQYDELQEELFTYSKKFLTTRVMAEYVLNTREMLTGGCSA